MFFIGAATAIGMLRNEQASSWPKKQERKQQDKSCWCLKGSKQEERAHSNTKVGNHHFSLSQFLFGFLTQGDTEMSKG